MSYLKYQSLISKSWDYPLPVLTKSGKPSFHRKGVRNGKVRLKENPLWEKDYINSINIDRPLGMSKREVLRMTSSDVNKKGFWSNPFLYTHDEIDCFKIDLDNYYPEQLYYNWLKTTEEGDLRRSLLKCFKNKYLITNDLLLQPLRYSDHIEHHGQVLLLLLTMSERYIVPKWRPYSCRNKVIDPTREALKAFYLSQLGLLPSHALDISVQPKKQPNKQKQVEQPLFSV